MSDLSDQPTQLLEPGVVQPARTKDAPPRPYQVGETLPLVCGTSELARLFGVSRSRVRQLHAEGKLKRFELRNPVDRCRRWSGVLLQRELEETGPARSFGGHRSRV